MYNPLLTAFVCAADCGSFTKAAEKLYLSPTAVMKQINTLESHLQLQLISRTNQGIRLTAPAALPPVFELLSGKEDDVPPAPALPDAAVDQ